MVNNQLFATLSTIAADDSASAGKVLQQSPGYVAGWGTLALINACLGQSKNRSGFNWFLISLLLGPIATFLLAISEKLPEPTAPEAAKRSRSPGLP
jgi:hypothetical protein